MTTEDPAVTDFYQRFSALVGARRHERALTQQTVADMAGLTRSSIANIESGRQHPPLDVLVRIGRYLDLDIVAALTGAAPLPDVRDEMTRNAERARQRATLSRAHTLLARARDELETVEGLLEALADQINGH